MNYVSSALKPISTNRYLFHATHPANREGIQTYGLLMSEYIDSSRNGVYAHNLTTPPDYYWWPFLLIGEYEFGPIEKDPLKYYDFWRIDTHAISSDWFIDDAARLEFMLDYSYDPKDMYVFTPQDIPVRALQLFRIQTDESWDYEGTPGTYHFRNNGRFRPYIE